MHVYEEFFNYYILELLVLSGASREGIMHSGKPKTSYTRGDWYTSSLNTMATCLNIHEILEDQRSSSSVALLSKVAIPDPLSLSAVGG